MNVKPMYFWTGTEVVESLRVLDKFFDLYCIDNNAQSDKYKYGKYLRVTKDSVWEHVPLSQFPKEFQMALILLGIT